jgi:hypothetical protein
MPRTPGLTAGAAPCERVRVARVSTTRALGAVLTLSCVMAWACGSLPKDTSTRPDSPTQPVAAAPTAEPNPNPTPTPILGGPAPKPTPTPSSDATPNPGPTPSSAEGSGACGSPLPPSLGTINVKIHQRGGDAWLLDSTPLVGPDAAYCAKIGFTDGRALCPVRQEGNPEREACELYVTGRATDTGRPGPTWTFGGKLCTGRSSGCENTDNQYQLRVFQGGVFRACGRNGACGEVTADR